MLIWWFIFPPLLYLEVFPHTLQPWWEASFINFPLCREKTNKQKKRKCSGQALSWCQNFKILTIIEMALCFVKKAHMMHKLNLMSMNSLQQSSVTFHDFISSASTCVIRKLVKYLLLGHWSSRQLYRVYSQTLRQASNFVYTQGQVWNSRPSHQMWPSASVHSAHAKREGSWTDI